MRKQAASSGTASGFPGGLGRFAVVLVRPDSPENIGLAARGMANTGFTDLRLVGLDRLEAPAFRTAVHAEAILDGAHFCGTLSEAVDGLHLVLGSTARIRRDFPLVTMQAAVRQIAEYPPETKIGLVFGNERTGLTSEEIGLSNVRFRIPQAARQPSYNLGVAVTLTLFEIAGRREPPPVVRRDLPLTRAEQEEAGRRFGEMLDGLGFMRDTNRGFITERVQDIFRRMVLTGKDRDVILAMFRKALLGRSGKRTYERSRHGSE
ncbi:MAG: TrmH family RNA methyltransferase [Candidatus Aminicenantales bacterium]|jgi:tRNA/rRNA methyltransferase